MAYIKEYWDDKDKRAQIAKEHTQEFAKKYIQEIAQCALDTTCYNPNTKFDIVNYSDDHITPELVDLDSVSAIFTYKNSKKKMAVLNFASYENPGGMFMEGSRAQEECLCHASFLYNVLREKHQYYYWNNEHKNRSMYMNRALYSPKVIFEMDGESTPCDVITCAAPNYSAATQYYKMLKRDNEAVLRSRIKFALDIAQENKVQILILGAYGCGVFGQDPKTVAKIFLEELEGRPFEKVVFAIPDELGENHKAFKKVFKIK